MTKKKESARHQETGCSVIQNRKSKILKCVDKRRFFKRQETGPGRRKLAACSPEFRNIEYTNHRYMDKIFQNLEKLGMPAISATFSMDAYKNNVLTWGLFLATSMKAAIHLGLDFMTNSEIYKNTKFEKIWSVFNSTRKFDKGTS